MRSQIKITLVGSTIPALVPVSASVTYSVNRIPVANVGLGPEALAVMCDFERVRRQPVLLTIESPEFCIRFNGVIDGLNIGQQPGGIALSLVLKHQFTFLNEIYPRILGMDSSSANMFALNRANLINPNSFLTGTDPGTENALLQKAQSIYGYDLLQLDFTNNVIDFLVNMQKLVVTSQLMSQGVGSTGASAWLAANTAIQDMYEAADINIKNLGPNVLAFLNQIDTSQCAGLDITPSEPHIIDGLTRLLDTLAQDTLFQFFIRALAEYRAVLVIGNGTAFVVPEAQYLLVPKRSDVFRGAASNTFNVLYPSQYESFTFNDSGENTIKGVYMIEDVSTKSGIADSTNTGLSVLDGIYVDPNPNMFGNIIARSLPNYATTGAIYAAGVGSLGIQKLVNSGTQFVSGKITYQAFRDNFKAVRETVINNLIIPQKKYLGDFAQIEYCRMKYGDRSGSIHTYYFNNFTPGAVGSLYTRQPGMYLDFYIDTVTHSFSLSESGGHASTQIGFTGGRIGNSSNTGLENIGLYDYTYQDSLDFCSNFIGDISKPANNAYV